MRPRLTAREDERPGRLRAHRARKARRIRADAPETQLRPRRRAIRRLAGPFPKSGPHPERSALFLHLNTNKRSITLNLKSDAGYSIYDGLTLRGIPALTFVRGQLVAKDYEIVAERPQGMYVL